MSESIDDQTPESQSSDTSAAELTEEQKQAQMSSATLDRKKTIIGGIITLVVLAIVFAGIIPKFGNYSDAWESIKTMKFGWLMALAAVAIFQILVYVWPYQAAIPGLRYKPAFIVRQTSFTISNAVPAGGAVGVAMQYGMLFSYGVTSSAATAGIAITSVWSIFMTLGLPILGVLAAVATGTVEQSWVVAGLIGLAAIVGAVIVFWLILRSEASARRVGQWIQKVIDPLARKLKKNIDITSEIMKFRGDTVGVVSKHWVWITVSNLIVVFAQFLVLFVAIKSVGGESSAGASFLGVFAAFAISRLASMIPVTPGGLGTVDAALIGLLGKFGVDPNTALAGALVWRAVQFIPQVCLGVVTGLIWRGQTRHGRIDAAYKA